MSIPVYGLSGFEVEEINDICAGLGICGLGAPQFDVNDLGKSFNRYAANIKNPAYRQAVEARHRDELSALNGLFQLSYKRIRSGQAASEDFLNLQKSKILLTLNNTDYHAYRIAQVVLPYVVDIDVYDGGFYFASNAVGQAAQRGELRIIDYLNTPGATEQGFEAELGSLKSILKKAWNVTVNATKAVGKAVVNSIVAPVKATVQATKATVNVVKAGVQAVTGNTSGAKESLQKALQNVKSSVVDPVKTAYSDTADVIKTNVVAPTQFAVETTKDITKATVQIAGKVFKYLFLKINPLTVLTRNALRALISLNFIGMATRLNVGLLTESQAAQFGYDKTAWQKAVKAIERVKKLYSKMGGNSSKLLTSITKGASKKPVFAKDIRPDSNVNFANNETEESTLGIEPATMAAIIGLCSTFISIIWSWIQSVVAKKAEEKQQAAIAEQQAQAAAKQQEMLNTYAHNNQGQFYTDEYGNLITWEEFNEMQEQASADSADDSDKKKKIIIASVVGVLLIGGVYALTRKKETNK